MKYKGMKGKAWKAFSDYIRLRDCLKTTGSKDRCVCITCRKVVPYSEIQPGHSIAGRNNSILLHPQIVNGQCSGCNMTGQYARYSVYMIETYGMEEWKRFIALSKETRPMKEFEWEQEYLKYKKMTEDLNGL